MSVPPLFKFSENDFLSIGLPGAENTFYQVSEEELKTQIALSTNDQKESELGLPQFYFVKEKKNEKAFTSLESAHTIEEKDYDVLYQKMIKQFDNKKIWIRNSFLIFGNGSILKIRHISEDAKDDMFILKNFATPDKEELKNFEPDWYFINTPDFIANLKNDELNHSKFCIINFIKKVVLIGGASYSEKLVQQIKCNVELTLNVRSKNKLRK